MATRPVKNISLKQLFSLFGFLRSSKTTQFERTIDCLHSFDVVVSADYPLDRRYKHKSFDGARTWIHPAAGTNIHSFNEVYIQGSAQLAVMPLISLQAPVRFHADRLYGDKSGFLHVGYNQNFSVAVTDPDIPFGLRVYENGSMMLPRRAFLQTVSFKSSGKVGSLSSQVKTLISVV